MMYWKSRKKFMHHTGDIKLGSSSRLMSIFKNKQRVKLATTVFLSKLLRSFKVIVSSLNILYGKYNNTKIVIFKCFLFNFRMHLFLFYCKHILFWLRLLFFMGYIHFLMQIILLNKLVVFFCLFCISFRICCSF